MKNIRTKTLTWTFAQAMLVLGLLCCVGMAQESAPQPNIVVLLSDDAGYADFSFQGAKDLGTPRIDSIAAAGVRCTQAYVSCPVCSPTRAGLLTGRYQQRFGHEFNFPAKLSDSTGLPTTERTLADMLRATGYRTAAVGKWHLGYTDKFHPCARGFDQYWGFLQGSRSYLPLEKTNQLNRLLRDREPQPESFDYMTDELARQAAGFIAAKSDKPLFLYVAFNAVHGPMQALPADLEGATGTPQRRKLIAMTRGLDRAVGHILDALERAGMASNTLVFFLNDNGGATNNASDNGVLRGRKGQVYEGGIRVPLAVRWPAHLPQNKTCNTPVIALDIAATALHVAGAKLPQDRPLDGVNLLPHLRGEAQSPAHAALHWRMGPSWAVRAGDWKLARQGKNEPMLCNLSADPAETKDLAASETAKAAELLKLHEAWASQLVEPLWTSGNEVDPDKD